MIRRIITGIILAVVSVFFLFFSEESRFIFTSLLLIGLHWEITRLIKLPLASKLILLGLTLGLCYLGFISSIKEIWLSPPVAISALLAIGFLLMELIKKQLWGYSSPTRLTARTALLYLSTLPYLFIGLENPYFACTFVISIAMTDTLAYFIGKQFGNTQLTTLSPKKTREGALAGLITTPATLILCNTVFNTLPFPIYTLIILGIGISILSQIGDIHESLTKRLFNQKDSSNILPGHGGIYDRLDSYLFTIPVLIISLHLWTLL